MSEKMIVQCQHCKDWFEPRFAGGPALAQMFREGKIQMNNSTESCQHCGKPTPIDNKYIKFV